MDSGKAIPECGTHSFSGKKSANIFRFPVEVRRFRCILFRYCFSRPHAGRSINPVFLKNHLMDRQDTVQTSTPEPASDGVSAVETPARFRGIFRAGTRVRLIMLVFAFLIPFTWLAVLRVTTMPTGENSQDALYHAMMGKLGPGVYAAKRFPWTQMSVWKDHFADKELLYHAGLNVIFAVEKLFGAALNPPFHLAALIYSGLAILCCIFAAWRLGVRPLYLLAGSPLFALIVPNYTFRLPCCVRTSFPSRF